MTFLFDVFSVIFFSSRIILPLQDFNIPLIALRIVDLPDPLAPIIETISPFATLSERSKIICYTDGLSELPDENGQEIGTRAIEQNLSNQDRIDKNIKTLIEKENIVSSNTKLFDDVSIIGIEFF